MQADKVDTFIMTNNKFYPANRIPEIKQKLLELDDSKFTNIIAAVQPKDPTTMLIISILVGALGIDRFMLGQIGMGVLKLLTGGLCGILWIIDFVTIQNKTKDYNFNNFMAAIAPPKQTT